MPNEYSIEIHNYLSRKIAEAEQAIQRHDANLPFHQGQLAELLWLRRYLREHVDLENFRYY